MRFATNRSMRSVEVRDEEQSVGVVSQESLPGSTANKRQFALAAWLPFALFISASFMFGIACGFLRFSASRQVDARCRLEGSDGITSELEAGLNIVIEWFPEEARQIRENRKDIIDHIASVAEPPLNSTLRTLLLTRHDLPTEASSTSSKAHARRLSSTCLEAVAHFADMVWQFAASYEAFPIPEEQRFYAAVHSYFVRKSKTKEVQQLAQRAHEFSSAEDTQDKALVIRNVMRDALVAGGGWLKFLCRWLARWSLSLVLLSPWDILVKLVTFAAQLKNWIQSNTVEYNFVIAFRIIVAERLGEAAVRAVATCRPRKPKATFPVKSSNAEDMYKVGQRVEWRDMETEDALETLPQHKDTPQHAG